MKSSQYRIDGILTGRWDHPIQTIGYTLVTSARAIRSLCHPLVSTSSFSILPHVASRSAITMANDEEPFFQEAHIIQLGPTTLSNSKSSISFGQRSRKVWKRHRLTASLAS